MVVIVVMAAIAFRAGLLDSAIVAAAFAGCCIGFLWYNSYPADIFMGDTGSLPLALRLVVWRSFQKQKYSPLSSEVFLWLKRFRL